MAPEPPQPWQRPRAAQLQVPAPNCSPGTPRTSSTASHGGERGPILTNLGDALDDYRVDAELRDDLGLLAIWRAGQAPAELELVGLHLRFAFTDLARGADADWIAKRLLHTSTPLQIERVDEQRFRITL